ncbi:hypothetical protein NQ314_005213 [Rhamnusium bicolor]|uniref:Regulatory protein zeste n=1 Tax=Rhamnusium bicolor TaxID=1586634 RepID=A0AAV8ZKD5_9CUCU|nr:hypothetical protein NQ314_005213 [Rhamnusium bicolor]
MTEKINKRSHNFSSKEENILLTLVKDKYARQIECKKTDTNANKCKTEAWLKLAKEFNSYSGEPYRDAQVLRNKFLNMKKKIQKNFSEQKKYMYGTGGGPAKKIDDTSMDNDMEQILGSQMTGFESEFDNDKENIGTYKLIIVILEFYLL